MPDGSKWDVPAVLIAENRASYYAKHDTGEESGVEYDRKYAEELDYTLRKGDELMDWAANSMNWSDASCELCGHTAGHPIHDDDEREDDKDDFTPPDEPDEPDSGFDVREPETVSGLFETYGRDLP